MYSTRRGYVRAGRVGTDSGVGAVVAEPILEPVTNKDRRTIKRARRVLGAALAQRDRDPELLAAAELICEAGGRR